jgi:hypothetical protein
VTLHNGILKVTNKEGKVKFMKPLSLPPSNILIVDRCDFYKDKDKYVSAAMKQKNTYQEIPTAGIKQKITYEEISTLIDGVMMVV